MGFGEDDKMIDDAIALFPKVFGLRHWPGKKFEIIRGDCYVSEGKVMLYVHLFGKGAFAKAFIEELEEHIVPIRED